jgi:very-short-patch-repair endonuclease
MAFGKRLRIHPEIRQRALEFRHPLTPAEEALWQAIRNRQVGGFKIRRQEPLGPYIADFYCAEVRLIVEIDGPSHNRQIEYDAIRTACLEGLSCTVIRFTNEQVFYRMGEVLGEIDRVCKEKQRAEI